MLDWINNCFNPHVNAIRLETGSDAEAILLLDNFSVHCTTVTQNSLIASGTRPLSLFPNTASISQPLDVGINKPFKDRMYRKFHEWLVEDHPAGEEMDRAKLSSWIAEVWADIERDFDLSKTLKKIGYIIPDVQ